MRRELPGFLFFLRHRKLFTKEESRMWFAPCLLSTEAMQRIIHYNRSKTEAEMFAIIRDIMEAERFTAYCFDVDDTVNMLEIRGIRTDHPAVRRILVKNWWLAPSSRLITPAMPSPITER